MERIEVGGMIYEFEDGISLMEILDENANRVYESTASEPLNAPLTLEELREMDDADVWVAYPQSADGEQLIMHALVEYDSESENVWFTNNLGGRSTFDEVSEDGGLAYRRKPEENE